MRENSTTGSIALRIISQNPIADNRNDIGAFGEEGWREPARQRLINGGPGPPPSVSAARFSTSACASGDRSWGEFRITNERTLSG